MNTHTAYTGKRDPINCPANQPDPTRDYHDVPFPEGTQPESATELRPLDEHYAKMYGNKPATSEWTLETLAKLGVDHEWMRPLCDAHNAALAAERDWSKELYQNLNDEKKSHRKTLDALAAERERKVEEVWKLYKGVDPDTGKMWITPRMERDARVTQLSWEIQQLRDQLSAVSDAAIDAAVKDENKRMEKEGK